MATEAADLAREVGDRRTEARALYVSGIVSAQADLEASIAIARESRDLWCLAHALGGAGMVCYQHDNERAQVLLRESVAVCEAMGDSHIVNTSRAWLGRTLLVEGQYAEAKTLLETVIDAGRAAGDTFGLPMALSILGAEVAIRGDERLGFGYLDDAAAIARRGGPPRTTQLEFALAMKAYISLIKRSTAARPILDELAGMAVGSGGADDVIFAFAGLAMVDVLEGDLNAAEARLRQARAPTPPDAMSRSLVNMAAAVVAHAEGNVDSASILLRQTLAEAPTGRDAAAISWVIFILEALAQDLLESGETGACVQLLAAIQTARADSLLPPPSDDNDSEEALAKARSLLADADVERAWADGLAMNLSDAIAFAQNPHN